MCSVLSSFTMSRGLILLTGLAAVVLCSGLKFEDIESKCKKILGNDAAFCCKVNMQRRIRNYDEKRYNECTTLPDQKPGCERSKCIADQFEIVNANGKVDADSFNARVKADFAEYPDIINAVAEKCFSGDVDVYGRDGDCDIQKTLSCTGIQILRTCPDWSNEGHCEGMKEGSAECLSLLP